ncbi:hypothetical protein [Streptomyces sp. DASNCL29]|uniref:hypothetical protein n=1 Tax=Streptomyces sp. DASNCL29 TaxID=2583819 RepID=UPI00110FBBCD|nr:hypothetical protein [Streptomyces sp. DASNCL29]TMU98205.1 hypothetical protein FGK60_10370 [Streptomyces sp. DASNCL29]
MEIPDRLISLQQAADAERDKLTGLDGDEHATQWQSWRDASVESQAAVTEHAKDAELNRATLEAAVKAAVRHAPTAE